ncbi:MAG: PHP domain-containing protein [Candidatus Hodarchaeales archaeon]
MLIDLHCHSTYSDGEFSPKELILKALSKNIRLLSITDHDNILGSKVGNAFFSSIESEMIFVQGVEIEIDTDGITNKRTELLVYGKDINDPIFENRLKKIRDARKMRNVKMVKNLKGLGFDISEKDVLIHLKKGETSIGRPHLAKALLTKNYVNSIDEAFDKYLGVGKPAYERRDLYPVDELIKKAKVLGAVTILAHPLEVTTDLKELEGIIRELVARGIDGVEVHYRYTRYMRGKTVKSIDNAKRRLHHLCGELNLLETGGSDYHGFEEHDTFKPVQVPDNLVFQFLGRIGFETFP